MTRLIAETITPPSASPVCWPVFIRLIIPHYKACYTAYERDNEYPAEYSAHDTEYERTYGQVIFFMFQLVDNHRPLITLIWLIISLAGINAALGIVVIRILPARHLARLRLPGNRSPLGISVLKALVIIRLIIIIIHLSHTPMFDQERRKATPIPKAT